MKIVFLGTGAADWDWKNLPPGTRKSSCALLGSTCLIDAGPCVLRGLSDAGASPARIADLLVTHSHSDHFNVAAILEIARSGRRRLRVWAPPQALALLERAAPDAKSMDLHPVLPGDAFKIAGMRVAALPANHLVERDLAEQPLHYVFAGRGASLLYALDGAWFCCKARHLLKKFLGGKPLSAIVWDATCGATFNDWRFAEHNDLKMIAAMRAAMLKDGIVSPETVHVFSHLARTLWPKTLTAQNRLAARFAGLLAQDGLSLEV